MRHGSALIVAMEGMSRIAFRIAKEVAQNSRSGLTLRFLSRKFDISESEIEYIVDLHDKLFFFDLTRVRLVAEGASAVERVCAGLENYGDVPSLIKVVRELDAHDFHRLEETLNLESPCSRNKASQVLIERCYGRPESIIEYVAQHSFSKNAQELFDVIWQSPRGMMPLSELRAVSGKKEYELERALTELFQGFALFELFRFDGEDRLVRFAAILHELREWREAKSTSGTPHSFPKPAKKSPSAVQSQRIGFSSRVCQVVSAIAARPVRVRSSGELFREDLRRLKEFCDDESLEPSLEIHLWAAESVGWLGRVDNEMRVNNLKELQNLPALERHRRLFDMMLEKRFERNIKSLFTQFAEQCKVNGWYYFTDFLRWAVTTLVKQDCPCLRNVGGHWTYSSPNLSAHFERNMARAFEEDFFWLGAVDRSEIDGETVFRVTELGRCLTSGEQSPFLDVLFEGKSTKIVVQPNFEIIVPSNEIDPVVTIPLERFATRVSKGSVTIYKLTKVSFTKALQDGHDGTAFIEFLIQHNKSQGLPSNVLTTLQDWCGSVKRIRLRTIHILESDDPLVIADIGNRRRFKKHLHNLDSGRVLEYNGITKREFAKELEKEGFVVDS